MKKLFTLALALVGFASLSSAATVDDLVPLKHSYVLVFDDYTSDGTGSRTKGAIFGDSHFLDVTGGSVNSGAKGSVDLATMTYGNGASPLEYLEGNITPEEIAALQEKYGEYGTHINSLRLKNTQDVISCKPTAGSVLYVFGQGNNKSGKDCRIPKFAKTADLAEPLNDAPTADWGTMNIYVYKFVVPADFDGNIPLYIGSYNGDSFFSYIIVEAQEAEGTPQVKVGQQTYEGGLWFKEVTVTPGLAYGIPTDVYYTTDGTEPTTASEKYTAPIKCYKETTLKFQAFMNGMAVPDANNEASVNFSFDAPAIEAVGASVTIVSPYEGAKNFYSLNGSEAQEGSSITLTESATVSAYSQIVNGSYATFTTKSTTKDVYVLNPIKEKKTVQVVAGDVVLDEEATAASTTGEVYTIVNGAISADPKDFFVKNLTLKVIKDAQYQVPEGNERYIQMSNTNITFFVAEGDSVNVKVVCSKNSCKTIDKEVTQDENGNDVADNDRRCYVNVSGTNYGGEDLALNPDGYIINFGLMGAEGGSFFTFQKYSGTGNIMISSIEIEPAAGESAPDDPELVAPDGWTSVITNGNLASDDVSCFFAKEYPASEPSAATIVAGAGKNNSRGIVVKSQDMVSQAWDSQFWIKVSEQLPDGTKLHVEFDYKADNAGSVSTQSHGAPGAYKHWAAIGSVEFASEWKHFSADVTVEGDMADMESIAFNLNETAAGNTFYFDNFGVWIQKPKPVDEWVDVIVNGNMEGTAVANFFSKEAPSAEVLPSVIFDGAGVDGSRGIKVTSIAGAANDWDSQFWIYLPFTLPEGTKYKVEFDYKADRDASADTQAHGEPGAYIHWAFIGSPSFTTAWQHFEKEGTISADQAEAKTDGVPNGNKCRSIAFNLSKDKENDVTFFFDNVKFSVEKSFYETGIFTVSDNNGANAQNFRFYNLNGQQVQQPTRGLYIQNGRKVVVK